MSYNNTYYLHFVTDLRRAVFCMNNDNFDGIKTFLDHANKIYEEHLKQVMDGESKELRFDEQWSEIMGCPVPTEKAAQEKYGEKILTLSSMIFLRSTKAMPVMPHASVLAKEPVHAVVSHS